MYKPLEKLYDDRTKVDSFSLIYEGIFVFGGKKSNGKCTNELKMIDIQQQPLQWITPKTKGLPPSARCHHSMTFLKQQSFLVIIGGLTDDMVTLQSKSEGFLSDIYILNLLDMNWC